MSCCQREKLSGSAKRASDVDSQDDMNRQRGKEGEVQKVKCREDEVNGQKMKYGGCDEYFCSRQW